MLVVKYNRSLLRKRRSHKEIKESYIGYVRQAELEFKELTPFEQKKIRDKIMKQAKADRLHDITMSLVALLILGAILFGIYMLFK
ncbi:Hypothetical protein I595_1422 [Croceitalea dokdonensis DOKDO 023]|uniref:Uncharacterized protein n=2 Tax=Croceitalea TaxID=574891 RepID=A0A0P7AWD0_9FLAO|nr:Hypothetical protein I595_1422 [Croceitalea dokdonensis DOKDO 023]